ncbi:MAG: hypothetical protein WA952_16075, partial [Lewinella sp.]
MKDFYLVCLFLSSILSAQQGFILPRGKAEYRQDMCVSPTGDRILFGEIPLDSTIPLDLDPGSGVARFPGTDKEDPGSASYLASYAPNGELNFAILLSDSTKAHNVVNAYYLDTDNDGNIYVQGIFHGYLDFDPSEEDYIVTNPEENRWMTYVASYTPQGAFRFVITLPDYQPAIYQNARLRQFGVDGEGNSYSMIGYADHSFDYDFGDGEAIMEGKRSVIASYDRDGNYRFAFETFHAFNSLGVSKMGDFYLSGAHRSEDADFDLDPDPNSTYYVPEMEEAISSIVLSFTAQGNLRWAHPMGVHSWLLDGDKDGNLYMAGPMNPGEVDFDFSADTFLLKVDPTYADHDYFLAKYARDGQLVKALLLEERSDSFALESISEFALSEDGDLYLSGRIYGENLDLDPSENEVLVSGQGTYGERVLIAGYDSDLNYRFGYTLGDTMVDQISDLGLWFKIAPSHVCGDYVIMADVPLPQTIDFDPREGSEYVPVGVNPGSHTVGLALITYTHDLNEGGMDCLLSGIADRQPRTTASLRVYPNPSVTGNFEIDLSFANGAPAQYLVADVSGRIVRR